MIIAGCSFEGSQDIAVLDISVYLATAILVNNQHLTSPVDSSTTSVVSTQTEDCDVVEAGTCWTRMPSGCANALSETSSPLQWFVDPTAVKTTCDGSRKSAFNAHCVKTDAIQVWVPDTPTADPNTCSIIAPTLPMRLADECSTSCSTRNDPTMGVVCNSDGQWFVGATGLADDTKQLGTSKDAPFKTIGHALHVALASDVIHLSAGIFTGGQGCSLCSDVPMYVDMRCGSDGTTISGVKSGAECVVGRVNEGAAGDTGSPDFRDYASWNEGTKTCVVFTKTQCESRPMEQSVGWSTYFCSTTKTGSPSKKCNYNNVVATQDLTMIGSEETSGGTIASIIDCGWDAASDAGQQRRGVVIEVGIRFTLKNVMIRRCSASCAPPFQPLDTAFDIAFGRFSEAAAAASGGVAEDKWAVLQRLSKSRVLCSGGGLAAKRGSTAVLINVIFEKNIGREAGGVVLDNAVGSFQNVSFFNCEADMAGAVLVTKGSTLDWKSGSAERCCAHRPKSGIVEIDDHASVAKLSGVRIENNQCDVASTCERQRAHAYRKYLCASDEYILYQVDVVASACEVPTKSQLQGDHGYFVGRRYGSRWPQPSWNGNRDCSLTADKPVGVRVTGNPTEDIFLNGAMLGGNMPMGQRESMVAYTRDVSDLSSSAFWALPSDKHKLLHFAPPGSAEEVGRTVTKISSGPSNLENSMEFAVPPRLSNYMINGEVSFTSPEDLHLRVSKATIRFGVWAKCSVDYKTSSPSQFQVIHAQVDHRSTEGRWSRNWDVYSDGLQSFYGVPTSDAMDVTSCSNEWMHYHIDVDATGDTLIQRINLILAYPLRQTKGKLWLAGLTTEYIVDNDYVQPFFQCAGCSFGGHDGADVHGSGTSRVILLDTDLQTAQVDPLVGTNTFLQRGRMLPQSRVWRKAVVETRIDNGWFHFSADAYGKREYDSGGCSEDNYGNAFCKLPTDVVLYSEDVDGDNILDSICKRPDNTWSVALSTETCVPKVDTPAGRKCPSSPLARDGVTILSGTDTSFPASGLENFRGDKLQFLPRSSGNSKYQVDGQMRVATSKIRICAWGRVTSGFDGVGRLFAWMFKKSDDSEISSNVAAADPEPGDWAAPFIDANRGTWVKHCEAVELTEPALKFSILFGYPMKHTAGSVMITGLSVQDANPESSISSHWKDLHSDESFGPTFSFDSAALYLPTLHSKADTQAFSFAGNVEAIACCSSASVPTSDSQVGIADAAKPQISWEPALAPAGTTYNTSISSSLLCYKATLGSGSHHPLCQSSDARRTGLFVRTPTTELGGSCDMSPSPCPANAAACGRNANAGVICYGCNWVEGEEAGGEYVCAGKVEVQFTVMPPVYTYPKEETFVVRATDVACWKFFAKLDGVDIGEVNQTVHVPLQTFGPHELSIHVVCVDATGTSVYTSDPSFVTWNVLDDSPTNTTIIGPALTKSNTPSLSLASNKIGASFEYKFSNQNEFIFVPGATSREVALSVLSPDVWHHEQLLISFEASTGSATKFLPSSTGPPVIQSSLVADASTKQGWAIFNLTEQFSSSDNNLAAVDVNIDISTGSTVEQVEITVVSDPSVPSTNVRSAVQSQTLATFATFELIGSPIDVYEIIVDGVPSKHTDTLLHLRDLRPGKHSITVAAVAPAAVGEGEDKTKIDPTPSRFQWVVLSSGQRCSEMKIAVTPLSLSAQRWSLLTVAPLDCPWSYTLDDGSVLQQMSSEDSAVVIGPLAVGPHSLKIYSGVGKGALSSIPALHSWEVVSNAFHETKVYPAEPLNHGFHSVFAKATDPLNVVDATGRTHTFFVDLDPPDVTWITPPPAVSTSRNILVSIECNDHGDYNSAECTNVKYTMSSGKNWSMFEAIKGVRSAELFNEIVLTLPINSKDGETIEVAITGEDKAGNVQTNWTSTKVSIVLDVNPPEVTLIGAVNITRFQGGMELQIEVSAIDVATFVQAVTCKVDEIFRPCFGMPGQAVTGTLIPQHNLAEGPHVIQVNATDAVGQSQLYEHTFVVDISPPLLTIASEEFAVNSTATTSGSVFVSASDAVAGVASISCTLDSEIVEDCGVNSAGADGSASATVQVEVKDGRHIFSLLGKDTVGNINPVRKEIVWVTDTTPPDLDTSPLVPEEDVLSIDIGATCVDALSPCFIDWEIKLDEDTAEEVAGGSAESCGKTYAWRRFNQPGGGIIQDVVPSFGTYLVTVRAVDGLGNEGEPFSRTLVVKARAQAPPAKPTRVASSSTNITFQWTDLLGLPDTKYIVEWSNERGYPENTEARTETKITSTTEISIETKDRLEDVVVLLRVRREDAPEWSLPSDPWVETNNCQYSEYLDTVLNPTDPGNWTCTKCPAGASCLGNVVWDDVPGMFGYWRVPGPPPQQFEPCIYAAACLGAPNPKLEGQFEMNGTDLAIQSDSFSFEQCNEDWGHQEMCDANLPNGSVVKERCRLCNSCMNLYQPGASRGRCDACPKDRGSNIALLALGFLLAIFGAGALVYLAISQGGGVVEMSEAIKKILINYLQVVSLAAVFPVRWPEEVEQFFAVQSAISSVSQTLLSPDCELSYLSSAEAFYQKQIGFAFLPIAIIFSCGMFWAILACFHAIHTKKKVQPSIHYSDRMVLSWVLLLYLSYPTIVKQGLGMMGCERIGGKLWLAADLQEPCYVGRHWDMLLLLCLPQVLLYVIGFPLMSLLVMYINRRDLHAERVQFRYGLLFAGYRHELYWWEVTIVIRKVTMVMVGGVFASRLGPDMQVYFALAVVVIFIVGHLVAAPYDELTIHHKTLYWLELSALLACFGTLYCGMLFYLGHETGRIPEYGLKIASFVIIICNTLFMVVAIYLYVKAVLREKRETKGVTQKERSTHLRRLSVTNRELKTKWKDGSLMGMMQNFGSHLGIGHHKTGNKQKIHDAESDQITRTPSQLTKKTSIMQSLVNKATVHKKANDIITNYATGRADHGKKVYELEVRSKSRLQRRLSERTQLMSLALKNKTKTPGGGGGNGTKVMPVKFKAGITGIDTGTIEDDFSMPVREVRSILKKKMKSEARLDAVFAKLDADGSSSISKDEFERLICAVVKPAPTQDLLGALWSSASAAMTSGEVNKADLAKWIFADEGAGGTKGAGAGEGAGGKKMEEWCKNAGRLG